jgi:hypothetical protein
MRPRRLFLLRDLLIIALLLLNYWQPGDLGVLRGVILGFSEEARTRGVASLALARFAFIGCSEHIGADIRIVSILGYT